MPVPIFSSLLFLLFLFEKLLGSRNRFAVIQAQSPLCGDVQDNELYAESFLEYPLFAAKAAINRACVTENPPFVSEAVA
jgi:hypothetical protein